MNNIRLIEDGRKLIFNFLNGTIEMNADEYGAFAMCPGCGAGKTTIIKQLIALKWYEGILYTAFTRDEVDAMYRYIIENLVGRVYNPYNGEVLELEDVIVLHSNYNADGTDRDLWLNKPQELANKKVILCTHHKLLNEPIRLLMSVNFDPVVHLGEVEAPDKACLTATDNHAFPRQWMLIDESTEADPLTFTFSKMLFLVLGDVVTTRNEIHYNQNGNPEMVAVPTDPWMKRRINVYSQFADQVRSVNNMSFKKNTGFLYPENSELNSVRNGQLIESLFHNLENLGKKYVIDENNSDVVKLNYSFTNNIFPNMKYKMILFDGTSDITLRDSSKFKLLNYPNKYNSPITMSYIPFDMSRRFRFVSGVDPDIQIRNKTRELAERIKSIIIDNNYHKTLIFTWKDLKSKTEEIDDSKDKDFNLNEKSTNPQTDVKLAKEFNRYSVNPNQAFYKYLETELLNLGLSPDRFSIEYYGSGKDKATNQFRDYDSIILAGRYQVPNSVIWEYNEMFGTNIGTAEYYTNRIIQAICRTRIRRHDKSPIGIHISSDWSNETVQMTKRYLGLTQVRSGIWSMTADQMKFELKKIGITPKKAEQIAKLSLIDCNIANALLLKTKYSCQLKLDDVFRVLPMCEKKVKYYNSLVSYLDGLGIQCSVVS